MYASPLIVKRRFRPGANPLLAKHFPAAWSLLGRILSHRRAAIEIWV
jgi:hypothetical protein